MTVKDLHSYLATQPGDYVATFRMNGVSVEPTAVAVLPDMGRIELFDVDDSGKSLILLQ